MNSNYKNCYFDSYEANEAHSTGPIRESRGRQCAHRPLVLISCYHPLCLTPAESRPSLCWGRKLTKSSFFLFSRIGVLCAYAANQNLSSQVKNIRRYVNSNMRDLHTFANDTPMVRVLLCRLCTSYQNGAMAVSIIYHICPCPRLSLTKYNETKIDLKNVLLAFSASRDLLLFVSLLSSVVFHVCSKLITFYPSTPPPRTKSSMT